MFDLINFSIGDMTKCGQGIRNLCASTDSMEEAANQIVHYLYTHLVDGETGGNALSLARFFKTHDYQSLDPELRDFAAGVMDKDAFTPDMKCLTLLASAGEEEAWNSRENSDGHKAIPLPSEDIVLRFPMISNLVKQLGLNLNMVLNPDPSCLSDLEEETFNVFYVPEAKGSAYIPAQEEFVVPYDIKSVLGFGGILPSGNLFAVIMFSRIRIPQKVADLFKPLTLSVKMAVMEHDGEKIFI